MARVLGVCINLLLKFIEIHSQEHVWVMYQRLVMVFEWGMLPCLLRYSIHKFWHEHIGQAQLQIQKGSFDNRSAPHLPPDFIKTRHSNKVSEV